ncbi:MAG: YigZ family protein [Bacilli bacterium]|nr:YigZ family protein [Bacilli bacterium]
MKTIAKNINDTKEINKSKFINYLVKVDTIDDIKKELDIFKNKYKDATHICYAYILDGIEKASDDGEPSGTAGKPILDILKKNDLNHILAIVVRYFGGIKLGAGGLIRAYANSINDLVKASELKELVDGYKVKFSVPYDKINNIENMNINIIYKEFDLNVIYEAIIKEEDIDNIKNISNDFEIIDKIETSF